MTTIIGKKNTDGTYSLHGDTEVTYGSIKETQDKIIDLDGTFIGIAGDAMSVELIKEFYIIWKAADKENDLSTRIGALKFWNTVRDNCPLKIKDEELNTGLMFVNENYLIIISGIGQITEHRGGIMFMGSGLEPCVVLTKAAEVLNKEISIANYYDIISKATSGTNNKITSLISLKTNESR